jgi:hypothetical protein
VTGTQKRDKRVNEEWEAETRPSFIPKQDGDKVTVGPFLIKQIRTCHSNSPLSSDRATTSCSSSEQ